MTVKLPVKDAILCTLWTGMQASSRWQLLHDALAQAVRSASHLLIPILSPRAMGGSMIEMPCSQPAVPRPRGLGLHRRTRFRIVV